MEIDTKDDKYRVGSTAIISKRFAIIAAGMSFGSLVG